MTEPIRPQDKAIVTIQVFNDVFSPYNYYQIRKVYDDSSFWVICYLDSELSDEVLGIAGHIAAFYGAEVKDMREILGTILLPPVKELTNG